MADRSHGCRCGRGACGRGQTRGFGGLGDSPAGLNRPAWADRTRAGFLPCNKFVPDVRVFNPGIKIFVIQFYPDSVDENAVVHVKLDSGRGIRRRARGSRMRCRRGGGGRKLELFGPVRPAYIAQDVAAGVLRQQDPGAERYAILGNAAE